VNAAANDGATPLFIASEKGHLEVVNELLSRGAAVDSILMVSASAPHFVGSTPLYAASHFGHAGVVRALLLRGAAVSHASSSGDTPLSRALAENRAEVVALLRAAV
jgi:ankyrin repeat protein